jgi:hypothetical protein
MTIFPALARFATRAARGFGNPRALRWRRVRGLSINMGSGSGSGSGGGVPGSGDDATEDERVEVEDLGVESSGVDSSSSGSSTSIAFESGCNCIAGGGSLWALRVLFATESDTEEEPDDSSNVRLGDRWTRRTGGRNESTYAGCEVTGVGGNTSTSIWGSDAVEDRGDGERDIGRGICVGVGTIASSIFTFVLANWPFLERLRVTLDSGFALARDEGGFFFTGDDTIASE